MFDGLTARTAPRRWRTLILVGSLILHAAAAVGAIVLAMWKVELLLPERSPIEIGINRPHTPPAEAPAAAAPPKKATTPRKHQPKEPVQPTPPQLETTVPEAPETGTGDPNATGTAPAGAGTGEGDGDGLCATPPCGEAPVPAAPVVACGDGSRASGEQCDDGNTRDGDGCSASCRVETRQLLPAVIDSLRVSGEAKILPPSTVQSQMQRDGRTRTVGVYRVCLDTAGAVARVTQLRSTGFDEYDQRLVSGIRQWRYRPYQVNGQAVPACGTVQFVYQQR